MATKITVMQVGPAHDISLVKNQAMVIEQSVAPRLYISKRGIRIHKGYKQIMALAESEDQCFQALQSVDQELSRHTMFYDHGAWETNTGRSMIFMVNQEVQGFEASADIAAFMVHMSKRQRIQVCYFTGQIWE